MLYRIVDAEERHLEDLQRLEHSCFSSPWTREQLLTQLPDDQHMFLVAENENGSVIGYIGMMYVLDEGYISNIAVDPAYRKQGVGDALIHMILSRSAKQNLAFVTLEVRAGNEPAKALYEKHGFAQVGRRKNYYERPIEDAILMTRFLK